jgi:copper chaperone NosL
MKKMNKSSRILLAVASLAMIGTYFTPVWFIFLTAPQYPEGLTMYIWLNKITGQVEIINGLNHYIGMKTINADMFPEFSYMVYIMAVIIGLGLLVALMGKRIFLYVYNLILIAAAAAAMIDFYTWSYDYGHNLDPKAAIQVPGLSYQPPLLGHKTLLNFDAYSYPDTGGGIIIGAAFVFFIVSFLEWRRSKKQKAGVQKFPVTVKLAAAVFPLLMSSCSTEPEPFNYGKDNCEDCKMTIMDPKFAAQIVTKKGRTYKFDDLHCLVNYSNQHQEKEFKTILVNAFSTPEKMIDATTAYYVHADGVKSPMNGNLAAFADRITGEMFAASSATPTLTWEQAKTKLK